MNTGAPQPILIRGGRVVDPSQSMDDAVDVLLSDGRIAALGTSLDVPEEAARHLTDFMSKRLDRANEP